MANDIDLKVNVDGLQISQQGFDNLTKSIEKFANSTEKTSKSVSSIEKGLGSFGTSLKSLTGYALAAGTALLAAVGGREVISAAIEKENSINKLSFALATAGNYSKQTVKEFKDLADQMERTTRFSDDQVLSTISMFESLNQLDKEGLKKATKSSADLAAVLGIDLESASSLVSKAIEGNSGALGRYGIAIKKGNTDSEQLANTLQALAKFQGQATNEVKTFGGALTLAKTALSNVGEELGNIIIKNPIFTKLIQGVADLFNSFTDLLANNQTSIIAFFNSIVKSVGEFTQAITPVFNFLIASISNLIGVLRIVIQGFSELFKLLSNFSFITDMFSGFAVILAEIPRQILNITKLFYDLAQSSTIVDNAFKKAGINFGEISDSLQSGIDQLEQFQSKAIETNIPKVFGEGLANAEALLGTTQDIVNAQKDLTTQVGKDIVVLSETAISGSERVLTNAKQIQFTSKTFFGSLKTIFTNFKGFLKEAGRNLMEIDKSTGLTKLRSEIEKIGPSLISSITKGKAGAVQLFSSIGGALGNAIVPGLGTAIQPFLELFAQGPEAVKKTIKEFVTALPDIIENIFIYGAPALVEGIIESLPTLIDKFTTMFFEKMASPVFWAQVAGSAASAFVKSIPMIVEEFIKGIGKAFTGPLGLGGGGGGIPIISDVAGAIGGALGFAKGGSVVKVPGGYPNDSFNARLTQGEFVVDRSTSNKLADFLDSRQPQAQREDTVVRALLNEILVTLKNPQEIKTTVSLNQKAFADIIVNLNRVNQRLA